MKRGGFGGTRDEHRMMFLGLLEQAEEYMTSAERVLRGGDCEAGVESALAAERYFGEARGNLSHASKRVLAANWNRFGQAMKRLNFLRQALKRCVG